MIQTKKGLSDVVTNVLIILLVLVAVFVVWTFVQPFIRGASSSVQGADQCLTVQIEPVSCATDGTVTVRRNAGSGQVVNFGIQATDASGASTVTRADRQINELESSTIRAPTGTTVRAFAVVRTDDPNGRTCAPSTTSVQC